MPTTSSALANPATGSFRFLSSNLHHAGSMVDTVGYRARPGCIGPAALIQRVPVELLLHIVDYLPLRHLLLVSGVSKLFRSVVARDARFYIPLHIGITLVTVTNVSCDEQLTRVRHVLQYALPQRLPVGIKIKCEYLGPSPQRFLAFATESVFPLIEAALPILVRLVVTIPDVYNQALHDTLRRPAPALRELKLSRSKWERLEEGESGHIIPYDIFQGRAPLLSRLSLQNVYLPERPIPTLYSATDVSLTYGYYGPRVHVSRFFPRVADLRLRLRVYDIAIDPSVTFDCSGLPKLKHLCFVDDDGCGLLQSLLESCDIAGIPTITYPGVCARVDDYRTLTGQMREPLSLQMTLQGFKHRVSLRTQAQGGPGLHRVLHFDNRYFDYDDEPFCYIGIVSRRLVDLRLDGDSLFDILEFRCPFPKLRSLRLYLGDDTGFAQPIWFPCAEEKDGGDSEDEPGCSCSTERLFDCPELQAIVLVARAPGITVCPHQVAFIGCAFGQLERPMDERARLEMIGGTFLVGTSARADHPTLDVAFPNIIYRPFGALGREFEFEDDEES